MGKPSPTKSKDLREIYKPGAKLDDSELAFAGILMEATRFRDPTIPSLTLYLPENIDLGGTFKREMEPINWIAGQMTGVYIPPAVKPGPKLNVIFYMHGDKVRLWNGKGTIRDYWNLAAMPLRQGLSASGAPFILVAPTLGASVGGEHGDVGTKLDDHLDHLMELIRQLAGPLFELSTTPEIDQLIIAGHSGAYGPISDLLGSSKKYIDKIKEVWAFDTMYMDLSGPLAALSAKAFVYAYFVEGSRGTNGYSRYLASLKRPNTLVMRNVEFSMVKGKQVETEVEHDYLMQHFWLDRCKRIGSNGKDPDDLKHKV